MKDHFLVVVALSLMSALTFAEKSFESTDTDHDGNVTWDEFYGAASNSDMFSEWDVDDDALINADEYNSTGINGDFEDWDINGDTYLDVNEFYDGIYDLFDQDNDGDWTADEWDRAEDAGLFDTY